MEYNKCDKHILQDNISSSITLLDTHACLFNWSMLKIDARNIRGVSDSRKFFNKKVLNSNFFTWTFSDLRGSNR